MSNSLISVVLTTYNRCQLLPRAINSVLNGTYQNFELIIVDDASPDATAEVVARFSDTRIRFKKMHENGGVLRARNKGFDLAQGDYVVTLDDDDELVPDALSRVAEEFQRTAAENIDVLWFDCRDAESGQKSGEIFRPGAMIGFEDYVCGRIQGDYWLAFKKAALRGNRFNENLRAHESLLWLRIHRTHKARHVPRVACLKYREHGGARLCHLEVRLDQLQNTTLALSQFVKEFGEDVKHLCPTVYGKRLAYLGLHQMAINDFNTGRFSIFQSMRYRLSLKYIGMYFLSFVLTSKHICRLITKTQS